LWIKPIHANARTDLGNACKRRALGTDKAAFVWGRQGQYVYRLWLEFSRRKMMAGNAFNFEGGEQLARMGASWFVSYSYYRYRNNAHMNWRNVSTHDYRIRMFNRTGGFHQCWLKRALEMNDNRLETNTIGLSGPDIKRMAKELLAG
jgi:hypothetical protein